MSKVIPPYLHEPYQEALNKAPAVIRWILSTQYMKFVWRHHWMHHRDPQWNFNLILGGDWLRGKHRSPSAEDKRQMREIGLAARLPVGAYGLVPLQGTPTNGP